MATDLSPFLVDYLLSRGLFSNRLPTSEDTQETPEKEQEQELTFEKVLQDILDGGLETGDTTSTASVPSAPSSTTLSTGGLGLGNIGGLFGDIEQAINDALSFDLGQAAIDAAEEATGRDLSFEGLFGIETPSFISDIQRATPGAVTSAIMSSPNQPTGAKIGAGLFSLMSGLIPSPLMALGVGLNMAGASDPYSAARDVALAYDPIADVTTISPRASSLSEDEPNVTRSELGMAFDLADAMAAEQAGKLAGISFAPGTPVFSTFDWADPGFGVAKAVDPISQLTTSALDTLGFGGFGAPGAFSAAPDPTSPFGFDPNYHSPEFDPSASTDFDYGYGDFSIGQDPGSGEFGGGISGSPEGGGGDGTDTGGMSADDAADLGDF